VPTTALCCLQFSTFGGPEGIRAAVLSGSEQLGLDHLSLLLQVRGCGVVRCGAVWCVFGVSVGVDDRSVREDAVRGGCLWWRGHLAGVPFL